ncbi:hypothetical protein Syun_009609 [Stephania yunnanensis]|uniref:Uncharacterized protein n=1 Tax=Stephania yunnanensis TaxID=152371 RepID=A0AAP0PR08_9MAGN
MGSVVKKHKDWTTRKIWWLFRGSKAYSELCLLVVNNQFFCSKHQNCAPMDLI